MQEPAFQIRDSRPVTGAGRVVRERREAGTGSMRATGFIHRYGTFSGDCTSCYVNGLPAATARQDQGGRGWYG